MTHLRHAALGSAIGGGVALLVTSMTYGGVWAASTIWPAPDANIGLGLAMLATQVVLLPLGVWLGLRRIGVPGAPFVAAGTVFAFGAMIAFPVEPPAVMIAQTLAVAAYTGVAVWAASLLAEAIGSSPRTTER